MKVKQFLACCLLLMTGIALIGCSGGDSDEAKALALYQNLFTGLSDEEYTAYQEWQNSAQTTEGGLGMVSADPQTLPSWIKDRFESGTTSECFDNILGKALYIVPVTAHETGCTLNAEHLTVTKTASGYDLGGYLTIQTSSGEQQVNLTGSLQLNDEHQISYIDVPNLFDAINAMQQNTKP